jgi:hypothetical protein
MPIDYSIALQGKPMQITSQEDYLKDRYALQNAQQANQLNMLKMDEYKRGLTEDEAVKNYFAQQDRTNPDFAKGLYGISPKAGQSYEKAQLEAAKEKALTSKAETDIETANLDIMGQAFGYVRDNPTPQAAGMALKHLRDSGVIDDAKANELFQQVMANPTKIKDMANMAFTSTLQAKDQLPKFISQQNVMVNGVPTTRELQVSPLGGPATTVAGSSAATYNKPAASTVVNVDNKQESEFVKELGKGQAKKVLEDKVNAENAAQMLATNKVAKDLLDKGMITGTGADFFVGLNKALNTAGIDFGKADAAANSQAYGGLMAANTAKIIKQFGAGTGLSNADREYALKAAAGDITMDEKAIRKLIDLNSNAAQYIVNKHNKNVANIKTNIPLSVNPADYSAGIPEGRGTTSAKRGQQTLDDIFKTR